MVAYALERFKGRDQRKTLRVTPAMAAGVTDKVWDTADLVLNFINTVTYFVPEGRESDSAVLGWGTHHAEAEPL